MRYALFLFIAAFGVIASDTFDQEKYGEMYVNGKMVRSGPSNGGSFWNQDIVKEEIKKAVEYQPVVKPHTGKTTEVIGVATVDPVTWKCKWVYFDSAAKRYTSETVEGLLFNLDASEVSKVNGPLLKAMPVTDRTGVVLHCKNGECAVQK